MNHVLILGLGSSGIAAAKLALYKGASVTILDSAPISLVSQTCQDLQKRGGKILPRYLHALPPVNPDLCIISPGISPQSSLGRLAASLSCPVISEIEFAYRYCRWPILAVTGTNGKSTTVKMAVHCLNHAGKRSLAAGNIGIPFADVVLKSKDLDYIVLEISSFQLEHIDRFQPKVAALLNISDDHLDRHLTRGAYTKSKLKLFQNMSQEDTIILNHTLLSQDTISHALKQIPSSLTTFTANAKCRSNKANGIHYYCDKNSIYQQNGAIRTMLSQKTFSLPGQHSIDNLLATLALCHSIGISFETIFTALKTVTPLPHRQELIGIYKNIQFINDSKATNPDALIQSLKTYGMKYENPKILLIAGGQDKSLTIHSVTPFIKKYVKAVYLIGENKDSLSSIWSEATNCKKFDSLEKIIDFIIDNANEGDIVLLSSGFASQDMFANYEERGYIFSQLVKRRFIT